MKIFFLLLLFCAGGCCLHAQSQIPLFKKGERVAFVGNSITHGGHYHSFIWLYYMTRFPNRPITIMNAGIGGECLWDIKDRMDYDVFDRRPTFVILTFGMNDIRQKPDLLIITKRRGRKSKTLGHFTNGVGLLFHGKTSLNDRV